ncbi:MAG: VCBS repeat-containing protein [Planctomycetia bacterium]|nr:VCBS repeat-containing protein [Planctomycetia bacterium]
MTRTLSRFTLALVLGLGAASAAEAQEKPAPKISFKKTQLDTKFRAEGVAVGDFNKDGKLDIGHGEGYYAAPDWKLVPIREQAREFDPHSYSKCFQAFTDDFNKDGWDDIMVVEFPGTATVWLENPKGAERPWARHVVADVTNNESPDYLDVDGDGKREFVLGTSADPKASDGPEKYIAIARPDADPLAKWKLAAVSEKGVPMANRFYHGFGIGDIDGDKIADLVTPNGWWKAPESKGSEGPWKFTEAKLGGAAAQMFVYDFDGDGDADVLSTAAHQLGMWWHEQTPEGWKTHDIDKSFSQTHAVCFVDLNGDGLMDFVTGKRYWAHGPKGDVDPGAPAVLAWFELKREAGKPTWTKHQIDDDSGIGTQFEMRDVSGDGLLDIAVSNKKGTFYFNQVRE